MPIDLNNRQQMRELDQENVIGSIEQLPEQIQDAWEITTSNDYREYGRDVNHIIVAGMGGSALGALVTQSVAKPYLKAPLEVIRDYTLPGYVNDKTLVILSSYSGTTEETLAAARDAQNKGAKIAVIAAGGNLGMLAHDHDYPSYIITPTYNPSNQPRMAIGYTITGQIGLLKSLGLIDDTHFSIDTTISFLQNRSKELSPESGNNLPKRLAVMAEDKIIYLVSSEHLTGATHVFNNQLNENAKHLTVELQLPELNHHYMEGLPHPNRAKEAAVFWFIDSKLYSPKLQLRTRLTKDVVDKNGYSSEMITMTGPDPFTQVFEIIQLGAYTNYYLAMLHGINPAPIPWVDYFKNQLHLASQ